MKSGRIEWIDRWRGILIVQIVAFHVFGVASHYVAEGGECLETITKWIENYNTISFFALAGVVWTTKDSVLKTVCGKARRLLVPYFVFGSVWALCFLALASRFAPSYSQVASFDWWQPFASVLFCNGYPEGLGRRVVNSLWFLPALFGASVAYCLVDRCLPQRKHQLLLIFPLFALWHALEGMNLPWDVNRIPYFVMFIVLGRWNVSRTPVRWIAEHWLGGITAALVLYVFAGQQSLVRDLFVKMGIGAWNWVFVTMVLITASAFLAQSVRWNVLGVVGRASLGILVLHKFPILAVQSLFGSHRAVMQGGGYCSLLLGDDRRRGGVRRRHARREAFRAVGAW